MERALDEWTDRLRRRSDVIRVVCFGSLARGEWGFGSDLDLLVIVAAGRMPPERRAEPFDLASLPVPADLVVWTEEEWQRRMASPDRFVRTLLQEGLVLLDDSRG